MKRRWAVAIWLALVITFPIAGSPHHRSSHTCEIEEIFRGEEEFAARQSGGWDKAGVLTVPVVLRLMLLLPAPNLTEEERKERNEEVLAARPTLETTLALSWPKATWGSVNAIWYHADIQFDLRFVEKCRYGIEAVRELRYTTYLPTPKPDQPETRERDTRRLRVVNARFNRSDFRGIALYAWPRFDGSESGYGVSLQSCFPGTGGVWLTASSFGPRAEQMRVAHILAHEIGHVLGLPHTCTDDPGASVDMRPCDWSDRLSLMADSAWNPKYEHYDRYRDRRALSAAERLTAKGIAKRFLSPATTEDSNARTYHGHR